MQCARQRRSSLTAWFSGQEAAHADQGGAQAPYMIARRQYVLAAALAPGRIHSGVFLRMLAL